jgi:uncharacterized protein YjbI with pentapeptide repeats
VQILNDTPLVLGWMVGKIAPPQWTATFVLKGTFALRSGEVAAWADEPLLLSGDSYIDDDRAKELRYPSDFAPFKPRADVLVRAVAHAPAGKPVRAFQVSVRAGQLARSLVVLGERQWKRGAIGPADATGPAPIGRVPLTPANAYGGAGYARNPLGRGWKSDAAPLIEDPTRPVRGPSDDADPAGFGPLPAAWLQRAALTGTYDDAWLKTRWPWFPKDFDWGYFNAAPRTQQMDGYLHGDEELEFQNLHVEIPVYRARLPGLRPRCFVADRAAKSEDRFREVLLKLDTLWVDMTTGVLVLVWRGQLDVRTMKLKEVERVVVASEPLAEKRLPADSYRAVAAVGEALPSPSPDSAGTPWQAASDRGFAAMDGQMAAMDRDFAAFEKEMAEVRAQAEAELGKHKAALVARGVDPRLFAQGAAESSAVAAFDQTIAQVRVTDPVAATKAELHRPWVANAERELAAMDDGMAGMQQQMDADRAAVEADRPKRWTRAMVQEAAAAGQSLAGENLAELDLSNLLLAQLSLRGAVLVKTNLSGSRLNDSDLRGADLTQADLSGTGLDRVKLDGADLTGATLAGATSVGISLRAATLTGLELSGVDLTGCDADRADFAAANLAGAKLDQANLNQADFTGANLVGTRFVGATLRAAQFDGVKAKGINCEGADLTGLHGSGGCDFSGGNFRRTRAAGAIFAEGNLDAADFSDAALASAQFGDASLRGAMFDRADLRGAMFDDAILRKASLTKANLLRAAFDRADLTEADCRGANFYEAGFWDAVTERADFRGANLAGTLLRG